MLSINEHWFYFWIVWEVLCKVFTWNLSMNLFIILRVSDEFMWKIKFMLQSFIFGCLFLIMTDSTKVKFTFVTMKCFLIDRCLTNITKSIIFRLEIILKHKFMPSDTYIRFISFTFSTIIKFTFLTTPCYFCLTLLNTPITHYTYFGIWRWGLI